MSERTDLSAPHSAHRPRVMIVDDDAEMRALLRDALERSGFVVGEHPSGAGLLPRLEVWAADAVVLDTMMEDGTGPDLLSGITQRHPRMPVVLVTAFGRSEIESAALRSGATYYMDKPFRVGRLVAVLRAALDQVAQELRSRWDEYG